MRIKVLAFLLIIFCACGRKSTNEKYNPGLVIKIDLLSKSGSEVTRLSEFAANVEHIPLETTGSSFMGTVRRRIVKNDNKIYIQNADELLCFDTDGKFLFKLQNKGRGPEEYTSITDFDISSDNKIMAVLSSINRKMLVYGISDTGFIFRRSITLKDPAPWRASMVPGTDKVFLAIAPWTGTEPTLSLLINIVGDTILFKPNGYKYNMVRERNYMALNEMLVYTINNMVCFKEEFSDTVFCINVKDNSFKPRMIFDSHGTLSTPEMRGGSETSADHTNFIANIFETSRYIFYYYGTSITRNKILFDKKTNIKYNLDIESKLKDDISGGPDFNLEFINNYYSGGKLFSFVEAITLKKYVASEDFKDAQVSDPKKKNDLEKLADSLNETDNPVLIIVTPKE